MTRLIRAELLRIRSRRLTWLALALVLLVIGLTQIAVYTSVRPLTATEQTQGQVALRQAQQDYEQNKTEYQQYEQECLDQGGSPSDCSNQPRIEDYVARTVSTYAEVAELSVTVSVFVTALALLLLNASLVGGEFSSGAMSNWLTFVPERTRVFLSKLLAAVTTGVVVTALTSALALGLTTWLTSIAGSPVVGLGEAFADGGRGILLGVVATVLGFGIAMLTRHTIAAVGTVLGYLFLSFVLSIMMNVLPALQTLKRLLPENNALALLRHGYTYWVTTSEQAPDGSYSYDGTEQLLPFSHSALYWVVVVVALVAASFWTFRRRDLS